MAKLNNDAFKSIQGGFSNYKTDLTKEAKDIIDNTISASMKGSNKGYKASKVYYMVYNASYLNYDGIKPWMDRYYAERSNEPLHSPDTVRKYVTVVKKVAAALVKAHEDGVKLFKNKDENEFYMNSEEQGSFASLVYKGLSNKELIKILQDMENENQQIEAKKAA